MVLLLLKVCLISYAGLSDTCFPLSLCQYAVLSVLRGLSVDGLVTSSSEDMLASAKSQLKNLRVSPNILWHW